GIVRSSRDAPAILDLDPVFKDQEYMAEKYIAGAEFSVGILETGDRLEVLPPLRITSFRDFYDETAKTDPAARSYECPARIPASSLEKLREDSLRIFELCGCAGFARVDWLSDGNEFFALELNTIPGLTHQGNFATMATAAGLPYQELVRAMTES